MNEHKKCLCLTIFMIVLLFEEKKEYEEKKNAVNVQLQADDLVEEKQTNK